MAPQEVHIIGGGLAGTEAAWQIAESGHPVVLHEMRPVTRTEAHETDLLAELVCSNSFRADDSDCNAVGLLHDEMRRCGSLILRMADLHKVPAGGALAVDRTHFAQAVTQAILNHPNISIVTEEVTELPAPQSPDTTTLIASGPLTSGALAESIRGLTGDETLHFFDAIAPIVHRDSIDMTQAWFQSRYDKQGPAGSGSDYINCPLNKEQYQSFVAAILAAEKTDFKEWEKNTGYFDGCLPIEIMAARGHDTLRYGPMKPVGLDDPRTGRWPYAVVQLRQDNALGTLYNIVGFQTKMKHGEQTRVFRMIPGLENAAFARLGGIHRNTFINSPRLLDGFLRLKSRPDLRFAGQITGVEGYVESAATGLLAGLFIAAEKKGQNIQPPPRTTALGALLAHITGDADSQTFQPMNVNFGLFPPPEPPQIAPAEQADTTPQKKKPKPLRGQDRKRTITARAKQDMTVWLQEFTQEKS